MKTFYCNPLHLLAILAMCIIYSNQHYVVIIGAGPAGLAAATYLLKHNLTDFIVLEAENRIGGRVNSVTFGDAIVELGAEWCHGQEGNVVYEMVKDLDLLEDNGDGASIVFSNGKSLNSNKSLTILQLLQEVYDDGGDETYENKSCGEFLSEFFPKVLKSSIKLYFEDDQETLKLALQSMPLYEHFVLSMESAFSWYDVAARSSYEDCEGNFNLGWKGKGYKQIFDIMSKNISKSAGSLEDKIQLNKVVSKIDYSGSKGIVTCTDGSVYTSNFVLFTPSLGVLKSDSEKLFHPPLSKDKMAAIRDLGFGAVIKVLQSYPDIWWPADLTYGIGFSWNEEDYQEAAKVFADGPVKNGKSWVSDIYSILPAMNNPHVIYIWITGQFVPEIEKLSDKDIKNGIDYVFKKFMGHKYNISEPDKMIRYGWYSNPHFRGTYSFDTIESKRENESCRSILAIPAVNDDDKNVLLFAGEATHYNHSSTVHGAIETGYREADYIIKSIK